MHDAARGRSAAVAAARRTTRVARTVARIVEAVRADGDARGPAVRRAVRRTDRRVRDSRAPRWRAGAPRRPRDVRRALAARGTAHRAASHERSCRDRRRVTVAPGVTVEQRVRPLERVGCYVPGGRYPLPSSLLMTAVPARVAGVPRSSPCARVPSRSCWPPREAAGVTRLFRLGGAHAIAALAFGTAPIPRVDRIVGPGNKYVAAAKNYVSREVGIDMQAGPSEILDPRRTRGRPGVARRRPDRAGRARSRCARRPHHVEAAGWRRRARARSTRSAGRRPGARVAGGARRHHRRRATATKPSRWPTAWRPSTSSSTTRRRPRRCGTRGRHLHRRVDRAGGRRLRDRLEPRAADGRRRAVPRRAQRRRLRPRRLGPARDAGRACARLAPTVRALARAEGLTAHAQSDRSEGDMSGDYHRPPPTGDGLRLHLNENTAGCSPKVLEAIARLRRPTSRSIPTTTTSIARRAAISACREDQLMLTNGLDEGTWWSTIWRAAAAPDDGAGPESIVVDAGVRHVRDHRAVVRRRGGERDAARRFRVPAREHAARRSRPDPARLHHEPEQPDRRASRATTTSRRSPRRCRADAIVFVDEAYHDFCGDTCAAADRRASESRRRPHVRQGAWPGRRCASARSWASRTRSDPLQRGDAALQPQRLRRRRAAGGDGRRRAPGLVRDQVLQSRQLVYEFCDAGASVLAQRRELRARARRRRRRARSRRGSAARGIYIRNKIGATPGAPAASASRPASSSTPSAAWHAMEEYLCGAR